MNYLFYCLEDLKLIWNKDVQCGTILLQMIVSDHLLGFCLHLLGFLCCICRGNQQTDEAEGRKMSQRLLWAMSLEQGGS